MKKRATLFIRFEKSLFPSVDKVLEWGRSRNFQVDICKELESGFELFQNSEDQFKAVGRIEIELAKGVKATIGELKEEEKGEKNLNGLVKFSKLDEEKRLVYGVVYEPDVVDGQGDSASSTEIEKACHLFMQEYQQIGIMHKEMTNEAKVVENYITPQDIDMGGRVVKKGTWVMVVKVISDELWGMVKNGTFGGFSMGGWAQSEGDA